MKQLKKSKLMLFTAVVSLLSFQAVPAFAAPSQPGGNSGSSSVSYNAAATISSSTTASDQTYTSTSAGENALLVSGGTSTLTNAEVIKSGSPSGSSDNYDFYGTNAAVLVYNGATLNLEESTITTSGSYASGAFSYGTGTLNISDSEIYTSERNSGGLMVTGGGTLTADNVTVATEGGSSAAIRSDRGGGTLTVNGGEYTTSGTGSPVIYSTADITVNDAELTAVKSEGAVVEGGNSITLNSVTLTDSNTELNGQSETYKNIFLYQSQSGDAADGTSSFTAKDSTITTQNGDTIYVTNATAVIDLENNTFENTDSSGAFLRAEAAAWGSSGSNGGKVTLNLTDQEVSGDIVLDSISTLSMNLDSGSVYTGTINGDNTAGSLALTLDSDSTLTLTGDSYVSSLSNGDSTNSNIILNGHTLYVNGTAVSADSSTSDTGSDSGQNAEEDTDNEDSGRNTDTDSNQDSAEQPAVPSEGSGRPEDSERPDTPPEGEPGQNDETGGQKPAGMFNDVHPEDYFFEAVNWASSSQITTGITADTFAPDDSCTRAQAVTFLWRAAGSPAAEASNPFTDVSSEDYYYNAVLWASENGITQGTSADAFDPDSTCTRGQIVTFLWRAAESPEVSEAAGFSDVSESDFYFDAVSWAAEQNITEGTDETHFSPDNDCSRGQIVTFLYRAG